MELEKSQGDSEVPAASAEAMLNLGFPKVPQENPKLKKASCGNTVSPAINTADAPFAEALINNCSFQNKPEPDYKTGRLAGSCINDGCRELALVTISLWLLG